VNSRPIPPWRNMSMSSMLSAPAIIPATSAGTLWCAFTPPTACNVTRAATSSASPHRWANPSTGASPATPTRFGSSKRTDTLPAA